MELAGDGCTDPPHATLFVHNTADTPSTYTSINIYTCVYHHRRQITGEDRNQLMKLQYRIGKLELDNMELAQSRIVHESAMRGKDLTIQKLQLQVV